MEGKGKQIMTSENEKMEKVCDYFPSDLITEIVQRISLETAPRMCSLSKEWAKSLWSKSLANPRILFMSPDSRNKTSHLWFHSVLQNKPPELWNKNQVMIPRLACPFQYISSQTVRGSICCYNKTGKSAILNPTRGVYKVLPKVIELGPADETHYSLGFDLESHVFKVLCLISRERESKTELRILNLLDENMHWRRVNHTALFTTHPSGICIDGKMYFGSHIHSIVSCFDLKKEELLTIKLPIWVKSYDNLVKVNGKLALIVKGSRPGARRIWTLEAAGTWSKLQYEIPPFAQNSLKCTYECVGTIGTDKFVFTPSSLLQEPLHVMYYEPKTSAPLKISINCAVNPPSRHVRAILDFVEVPNFSSTKD